mmetsp:Transcript_5433/g.17105  ORF Transcript_5433/g.17105 Transcript_5433/m.17105 type:complete len:901 (+) Transcript_5433:90-2792(+)|eukprot:CAMPEP_0198667556 /NCGR_PEP_ID=MMETSP1467-20131203/69051_1 /TAXON_ID=1462469 /ORGANISM="unid. sp., Strain CCMP2135" /LENGTH=900 /DNA_ID=CAMNT_0044404253 /DNA_START=73 /DNA_END=2778 /DNA_ORIENTATION=-
MTTVRVAPEPHLKKNSPESEAVVSGIVSLPHPTRPTSCITICESVELSSLAGIGHLVRKRKHLSKKVLENGWYSMFMTGVTLYALFGNDIRLSLTNTSADEGFVLCAWLCVILFALEMLLNSFGYDHYFGAFYFWIDLLSTLSILSEIPVVVGSLSSVLSGEGGSTTEMMEAGKAGRVGTRASRIIRIVRLVRMVRVVKLYKMHNNSEDALGNDTLEPTQVGKKLTEVTTQRLILMMLTIIMVLPWLQTSSLIDNNNNFQHNFLKHLHQYPQNFNQTGAISESNFKRQVQFYVKHSPIPLLYLEICEPQARERVELVQCNKTWSHDSLRQWVAENTRHAGKYIRKPRQGVGKTGIRGSRQRALSVAERAKHRISEFFVSSHVGCYSTASDAEQFGGVRVDGPTGGGRISRDEGYSRASFDAPTCLSIAVWSVRARERLLAGLAICKTFFIMVVLVSASIFFNKDAQLFVIGPIERMMTLVKRLSENPLDSANLDTNTYFEDSKMVRDQGYETILLEQTLERIGQLLQVGFGAAGAEIIGKNMNMDSGKLNAMIAGKIITAIYGFCDIRQFTDTTECLQEEVMVYVNKLGNLIHTATHSYFGMANKNVGDAFLLSWKLCDGSLSGFSNFSDEATEAQRTVANESIICQAINSAARISRQITPSQMADAAVAAFLRCQVDLENENSNGCLSCYGQYDAVMRRFGHGFRIQMGFGMHVGWAIEGAIGSDLKIDATYLSPHVEMSDRLEAASKIFKAKLNMSHWLINLATPDLKQHLRPIARIRCEGVPVPLTVYTYDITDIDVTVGFVSNTSDEKTNCRALTNWNAREFKYIQRSLDPDFRLEFASAYDDFICGDWSKAQYHLNRCLALNRTDGPSGYIVAFISKHGNVAPTMWDGAHYVEDF